MPGSWRWEVRWEPVTFPYLPSTADTLADNPYDLGTPQHREWVRQWSGLQQLVELHRRRGADEPTPITGRGADDDVHPWFVT